jgi:hypothetical protein
MLTGRFGVRSVLLTLVVLQIAIACLAAGKAWAGRSNDPHLPTTTPNPESVQRPLTVESGVELGEMQTSAWLSNALLLNVNMQIDWPSEPSSSTVTALPPGGWIAMTFVAPWVHDEAEAATLGLYFDRGSGQLFGQSQTEWLNAPPPRIALPESGVDSTTAVLAAELAGGTAFRSECAEERNRTRISLTTEPSDSGEPRLIWLINYTNRRNEPAGYRVIVDAESGKILRTEDERKTCDS